MRSSCTRTRNAPGLAYNVIDGGSPSVRGGVVFGGEADYQSSDNVVELNVIAYATSGTSRHGGAGRRHGERRPQELRLGRKQANIRGTA